MRILPAILGLFAACASVAVAVTPYSGATTDQGDYYLYQGETQKLLRATEEVAVRFKTALTPEEATAYVQNAADPTAAFLESLNASATIRTDLFTVTDSNAAEATLRADANVAFVTPVFISPESSARIVLTDEIIVGTDDDVTFEKLTEALADKDLEFVQAIADLNAFVFRVTNPTVDRVFAATLAAGTKAGVTYAEPNFVSEWFLDPDGNGASIFNFPIPSEGPVLPEDPLPTDPQIYETFFTPLHRVQIDCQKRITTRKATFSVRGTATGSVVHVVYRAKGHGPFRRAKGTKNWRFTHNLRPGVNRFTVVAKGKGIRSKPVTVIVIRN